ncbi:MAG: signal peptidase II [Alphaproteobacteria bacterium]|nr:signal peptidase II [Alphaproteobacteria bacterium]
MAGPYFKNGLIGAAGLLAADQLSKWWILNIFNLPEKGSVEILPFFSLSMVWNYGISMGIPLGDSLGKWGIIVLTAVISVWVTKWLHDTPKKIEGWGLAMILGGAIGNIIDRFIHGAVVDFLHFHYAGYNFYVFNVADSAITIGVALLLIDGLRGGEKGPKNASKAGEGSASHEGESS